MGGYRVGSGRSKSGYYKGIYCGSTYELCWVVFQLDHGVNFTRFSKLLEWNGVKYFPDFLLSDGSTIIEVKGYESPESVAKKTAVAEHHGYKVVVLRKEDLTDVFSYVSRTYTKNYQTLYDGYKPSYAYTCYQCDESFGRDKRLKTELVFCSRKCAGLFRKSTKSNREVTESSNYTRQLTKETALAVFNAEGSYSEIAAIFELKKNNVWAIKTKLFYKWIHQ